MFDPMQYLDQVRLTLWITFGVVQKFGYVHRFSFQVALKQFMYLYNNQRKLNNDAVFATQTPNIYNNDN